MLEPKKMNRLNELARKKKVGLLTEAEVQEQAALRKEYLAIFRTSMKETLEQTTIIDPAGNDVTPEKVKAIRTRKMVQ
ncbi:MAG: DUF896 domain-containing protein [Defluviitaleaceae bacterium]|nr:DUF896 domain-containing protein [Defluviitaleaceae bacterium]